MSEDLGALVAKLQADFAGLKKGLQEARQDYTSFQNMIQTGAAEVKKVLAFAGISLGFYALASEAKAFVSSILEVGQKSEVLRGAAYAIGEYYNVSSAAIDLYVNKLTQSGVSTENALQSINNFLKAGLSVDFLPQVAAAARDLAPSMAMPFNEAFNAIVQSVTKGTPKALMELSPGIKQAVAAATSETGKMVDATIVSGTEKSRMLLDFVLQAAQKVKGAGDSVAGTYLKQINDYKRAVREAKEALFEIVKPISMAITGSEIKSWQDFYVWIAKNKQTLKDLSEVMTVFIQDRADDVRKIIAFVAEYKSLAKILLEVYLLSKTTGWFVGIIGGVSLATTGVVGLTAKLAALRAAISVPWGLVIAVSVIGLYEAAKAIDAVVKRQPSVGTSMLMGEAEFATSESDQARQNQRDREADEAARANRLKDKYKGKGRGPVSPFGGENYPAKSPAEAKAEVDAAALQTLLDNKLPAKAGKGGGAKETTDNLLAPLLAMYKIKREADLQDAQNSLDLLKTTNEKKRAELEKDLATGLIDGQVYYQRLQDLQAQETTATLAMIARKREAQKKAYQESLTEIEADAKLSDEAKSIARQKFEAENRKALAKLDTEAAQARLAGEIQITNELKRQVKLRTQDQDQIAALNIETAELLGAITEQEAKLQKLTLDWLKTRRDAIDAGRSPELLQALDKNYQAKKADIQQGDFSGVFSRGFSDMVSTIINGSRDVLSTLNSFFNDLFKEAIKPGLDELKKLLKSGFKTLFGEVGPALGGAIMGAVALVGLLLTRPSSSSFTPGNPASGITGSSPVRGIIAGDTSIPIGQIGNSLADALIPTNGILSQIESNTRGGGGGSGGVAINVDAGALQQRVKDAIRDVMEEYFRDVYMQASRV